MKKLMIFVLSFVMIFTLIACGNTEKSETNIPQTLPSVSEENSTATVKTEMMDEIQSNDTQQREDLDMFEINIALTCPDAEVLDGLAIRGSMVRNSQAEVSEAVVSWLKEAEFIKYLQEDSHFLKW